MSSPAARLPRGNGREDQIIGPATSFHKRESGGRQTHESVRVSAVSFVFPRCSYIDSSGANGDDVGVVRVGLRRSWGILLRRSRRRKGSASLTRGREWLASMPKSEKSGTTAAARTILRRHSVANRHRFAFSTTSGSRDPSPAVSASRPARRYRPGKLPAEERTGMSNRRTGAPSPCAC